MNRHESNFVGAGLLASWAGGKVKDRLFNRNQPVPIKKRPTTPDNTKMYTTAAVAFLVLILFLILYSKSAVWSNS